MVTQQGDDAVPVAIRRPGAIIHGSARLLLPALRPSCRPPGSLKPPGSHRAGAAHPLYLGRKPLRALWGGPVIPLHPGVHDFLPGPPRLGARQPAGSRPHTASRRAAGPGHRTLGNIGHDAVPVLGTGGQRRQDQERRLPQRQLSHVPGIYRLTVHVQRSVRVRPQVGTRRGPAPRRARYVPDRMSNHGQPRSLRRQAVKIPEVTDQQVDNGQRHRLPKLIARVLDSQTAVLNVLRLRHRHPLYVRPLCRKSLSQDLSPRQLDLGPGRFPQRAHGHPEALAGRVYRRPEPESAAALVAGEPCQRQLCPRARSRRHRWRAPGSRA